jgi:hypothetical protein
MMPFALKTINILIYRSKSDGKLPGRNWVEGIYQPPGQQIDLDLYFDYIGIHHDPDHRIL